MTGPDDTYTHGHHDSVLRSHRWRTVENSAAYLLAHLRPGVSVLDVGCMQWAQRPAGWFAVLHGEIIAHP